jgi:hypothetical protein
MATARRENIQRGDGQAARLQEAAYFRVGSTATLQVTRVYADSMIPSG